MKPNLRIKKLKNNHKRRVSTTCPDCGSKIDVADDSLKWEHDRDGRLAREKCPNCDAEIFFY